MNLIKSTLHSPYPIRYQLYQALRKYFQRDLKKSYQQRILQGIVERPHYGFCLYQAASLAQKLGIPKISAIEFGVAGGNGLINIESHAQNITRELGVEFEIYGFDMGSGLPEPIDYRDLPYAWSGGFYKMDREKLEARLKKSKLVIGNVSDTIQSFFAKHQPAPLGMISFDLDYYSSTADALKIFNASQSHFLPRVQCYFDDVGTIDCVGELLAIQEFNQCNPEKRLSTIYSQVHNRTILGERIFEYHDFKHPHYNTSIYTDRQNPLYV